MDSELKFLLSVSRRLPQLRGAGKISTILRKLYLRKPRSITEVDVLNFRMQLNPADWVDGELLFHPHLFDREEVSIVKSLLKPGDTFLDAGSHIGFYSLALSSTVGPNGRIIAIEAHPQTFARLKQHLQLNEIKNVVPIQCGLSDKIETLKLGETAGNSGANSFLRQDSHGIDISCKPLLDVLNELNVHQIHGAKFDIEGFECRVLNRFLSDAPKTLWPRFIMIEQYSELHAQKTADTRDLLKQFGYKLHWHRPPRQNHIFLLA